jgi:tryptophan 2,3-dioxygenase
MKDVPHTSSFGLPLKEGEERLTYGGYLNVGELTALQNLKSDPAQHDETLFIIIHQVYELWFKQVLHELDAIIEHLDRGEVLGANRLLRRCVEIQRVLVNQVAVLETMTPMDFLAFRDHLRPASGFQSAQFREIEFVSGLKDRSYIKNYAPGTQEHARLEARLARPSLSEAFYDLLTRRGFDVTKQTDSQPADGGESDEPPRHMRELMRIYTEPERHYDLFLLAESLVEYDEMFALWRLRHIKMVERMIGSKPGTGGSPGAAYLKKTVERKFFPDLWELRTYLGNMAGNYGNGGETYG